MRKRPSTSSCLCLWLTLASACTASGKGVKAGLSMMEIQKPSNESGQIIMEPGYALGTFVGHDFTPWLSTQGEVVFSVKNFRIEDCSMSMSSGCTDKARIRLYYLEVPLVFRVAVTDTPNFRLHLGTGPVFAISMGGHQVEDDMEKTMSDLNSASGGFVMKASFAFGGPAGFVILESSYMRWFGPIASGDGDGNGGNGGNQEQDNDVFAGNLFGLMLGYEFP